MLRIPLSKVISYSEPYKVGENTPLIDVIKVMSEKKYGCVLIYGSNSESITGIFTERDFLTKASQDDNWKSQPISKYMVSNPKGLKSSNTVFDALRLMRIGKFRHLLVQHEDKNVSVISIKDILDYIVDSMAY